MPEPRIPSVSLPPHAPLTQFYRTPETRPQFVNALFDSTAGCYDRVSGLLAFGSDRYYRRHALQQAGLRPGMKVLDVATGTGLVLKAALELGLPARDLVGLDPSRGMLEENRKQRPVGLVQGRGERLPFADGSFDFIVMGYALRHVEDLHTFFAELRRVLKPHGRLLILEIKRPESRLRLGLLRFHILKVVPWVARLLTGQRDATRLMGYYWATIEGCVPPATITTALSTAGFQDVRRQTSWGILSDYLAVK
jgi:demethylmenaquinone methyltransferase/2-methoxy-6-polyprenyl-1,4-benzoquinol methylase